MCEIITLHPEIPGTWIDERPATAEEVEGLFDFRICTGGSMLRNIRQTLDPDIVFEKNTARRRRD